MTVVDLSDIAEIADKRSDFVLIEESPNFPGQLQVSSMDDQIMKDLYPEYISFVGVMNSVSQFEDMKSYLEERGTEVYLLDSASKVLEGFKNLYKPLEIDGLNLINKHTEEPSDLREYQVVGLNKAIESLKEMFFFSFGTGCLSKDTFIHTEKGVQTLGDVVHETGEQWSDSEFNVSTRKGTESCSKTFHHGYDVGLHVKTHLGLDLKGTKNHKVLSLTDSGIKWRRLDELSVGDHTLVPRFERQFGTTEVDPRVARLLGWIVSEGWCSEKYGIVRISQSISGIDKTDSDGNSDVRSLVSFMNGYEAKPHSREYRLTKSSTKTLVDKYGLRLVGSHEKSVPDCIMSGTKEVVSEFLSSLFEGDGGVGVSSNGSSELSYSTASETLARQVQQLLLSFGIISRISSRKTSFPGSDGVKKNGKTSWRVTLYEGEVFEREIGFISERKKARLSERNRIKSTQYTTDSNKLVFVDLWTRKIEDALKSLSGFSFPRDLWEANPNGYKSPREIWRKSVRESKKGISHYGLEVFYNSMKPWEKFIEGSSVEGLWRDIEEIIENHYWVNKVTSIEEAEDDFWDLSVPGSNSYLANGQVTHNTGKSVLGVAGALEMINRGEIDLALFFTLKNVKPDIARLAQSSTPLKVRQVEGTPAKRKAEYDLEDADIYVLNYEKVRASVDGESLLKLVSGKKVLFILDEVQKILNENQARGGLDVLLEATSKRFVWPMSASIIDGDPERYWKVFEWAHENPLGSLADFRRRYVKERNQKKILIRTKGGNLRTIWKTEYTYDTKKLQEVRHRVTDFSHVARKTDPGVKEHFKGLRFEPIPLTMSPAHDKLHRDILSMLDATPKNERTLQLLGAFYQSLRYNCLTPLSHPYAGSEVSQAILDVYGSKLEKIEDVKMERLVEDVQVLMDSGDKVVVFTHWTNMSLKIIASRFKKEKIPFVTHYGDQTERENQEAQEEFKSSKTPMVFLTSDAGSHGLNLPQARVVINYECPMSYDLLTQRNDRIDRLDSYLEDLEARVYYYENTLEEKIWLKNNQRRLMASAVQGTSEILGDPEENITEKDLKSLLFGV